MRADTHRLVMSQIKHDQRARAQRRAEGVRWDRILTLLVGLLITGGTWFAIFALAALLMGD